MFADKGQPLIPHQAVWDHAKPPQLQIEGIAQDTAAFHIFYDSRFETSRTSASQSFCWSKLAYITLSSSRRSKNGRPWLIYHSFKWLHIISCQMLEWTGIIDEYKRHHNNILFCSPFPSQRFSRLGHQLSSSWSELYNRLNWERVEDRSKLVCFYLFATQSFGTRRVNDLRVSQFPTDLWCYAFLFKANPKKLL